MKNNKFRMSQELKDVFIYMMGFSDSCERLAGILHNEYCDKPTELPNSKLLKEIIRFYNYCEGLWGQRYIERFLKELNKQMEWSGVEVTA